MDVSDLKFVVWVNHNLKVNVCAKILPFYKAPVAHVAYALKLSSALKP